MQSGLFIFLLTCVVVAAMVKRPAFLWLSGFLLPLMTPRLNLFIGVDWFKALGPLAAVMLYVRSRRRNPGVPAELRMLTYWILYATAVSLIWMLAEYTVLHRYWLAKAMGLGVAQSVYKMPVQLGTFIVIPMCAWIVPWHAVDERDTQAALRGLCWGILTSLLFGIGLLLVTGRGMLSANEHQGIIAVGSAEVGRIGGLSGEPKMLGAVLVVAIVALLCRLVFVRTSPTRRAELWVLLIFSGGLFATYSTSAWVALGVGVSILTYLAIRFLQYSRIHRLVAAFLVVLSIGATTPIFWNAIDQRLAMRLLGSKSEIARQKDNFLWEALERKPVHGIWGFGFGGTDLEVIPFVPAAERAYRRTPTAAVTGMRLLGDTGALGVCLFIAVLIYWSRRFRALGDPNAGAFVLAGGGAALSCSIAALPCFLFIVGAYWTRLQHVAKPRPQVYDG